MHTFRDFSDDASEYIYFVVCLHIYIYNISSILTLLFILSVKVLLLHFYSILLIDKPSSRDRE